MSILDKIKEDCNYLNNVVISRSVFEMEIDKWPSDYKGVFLNLKGELVNAVAYRDFILVFEHKRNIPDRFHYFLFSPSTMCYKEGWYMTSSRYETIQQIIKEMELPFKIKYKGFKSWLN